MSDEYTLPVNDDVYITGETEEVVPDFSEIDDDDSTQETVTRTPANISSDNRSSIGSGELNPSPSDVVPADVSTSDVIVTQRVRHQIDDYEPAALKALSDAGAVFYGVYADGHEEGPVPWSEVHDLDPEGTIIELDEEIASAIAQNFWADTQGVHITDDPYNEWIEAYESNPQFPNLSTTKNYYNILLNAGGALLRRALNNLVSINRTAISFYDGLGNASTNIMAFFGRNGAQIGRSDEKHVVINSSGIGSYNGDGTVADFTMRGSSIVNSTISGSALVDNTITGGKIANATITGSKIDSATITNANIANGTITGAKIDSGTITNANIADGTIQGSKIQGSTLTDIPFAAITDAEVEVASIADAQIATATITEAQVENLSTDYAHLTQGVIDNATIDHADVNGLNTTYATISNLNAATARIGDLEADHVSVSDFEAEQGYIDALQAATADIATIRADSAKVHSLTAAQLSAATAYIAALNADNITAASLSADVGKIHNLTANEISAAAAYIAALNADSVTAQNIIAMNGDFATVKANAAKVANLTAAQLEADHATVGSLDANYAQINMANVNNAWIANGTIKDGAISNGMINSVSANKLTAGTIDASNITVTNLNADNITTGTINGQRIGEGSLSLSKLEEDVYTETEVNNIVSNLQTQIDGAIETWTGTAVPTLSNSPASTWTTNAIKDSHVGDVYFVVNSQSQQNGYNYRFTKSGNTYSWQLIKDSDVTNALQRLTTAEGKIGNIEQFDSDISSWKIDTDEEISSIKSAATTLTGRVSTAEGQIATKVDTTTFNTLSQTVGENSAAITQLSTETTSINSKVDSQNPFIIGTQTAQTGNWTGNAPTLTSLVDGQQITYWLPYAPSGNASLNLTLKDGSETGAIPCYYGGTSRLTTHYAANNAIHLTYRTNISDISQGWWADANYDTNSPYTKYSDTVISGKNGLKRYTLCMRDDAGNFTSIVNQANNTNVSGKTCYTGGLQLGSVCYHSTGGDYAAGANSGVVWESYGGANFSYSVNGVVNAASTELQLRKPVYLVGTIGADGLFYLDTTKWWTQTSFVENKAYVFVGTAYSSYYAIFVAVDNPTYIYEDGELVEIKTSQITKTTNKVNTVSDTVDEHTRKIGVLETTVETKADGSDVTTISNRLNTVSETVDGHTQSISSITSTQTTMQGKLDKTLVETTQLWFSKADTTAPNKPTTQVTSTATTGNAWTTVVPAYNASYPNYYYCYQWKYSDGTYGWSSVTRDIAMGESQERARTAITNAATADTKAGNAATAASNAQSTANKNVKSSTQLWYTKANDTAPTKPASKITSTSVSGDGWRVVVPTYSASYPYYFYCWQYELADGTCTWSDVIYDRATTENQSNSRSAVSGVSTLTTKTNNIQDTVDGHTSQLSSITSTQTTIQGNAVKSTVQLWFTKANTTAPNKPTAHVTTNNAATGNAWNLAVPTYNASYPNYYYCYEYEYLNGTYGWSAVTRDIATGEMQERARTAITNAANAQADIDGLEIGGRNLIGRFNWSVTTQQQGIDFYTCSANGTVSSNNTDSTTWSFANCQWQLTLAAGTYQFTTEVLTPCETWASANLQIINSSGTVLLSTGSPIFNNGGTLVKAFTLSAETTVGIKIKPGKNAVCRFKLEKGTKATDWTPAPEDIDADISTAQTSADNAQATADKNLKESQQLWFTKANGSAPAKPTTKVTSTSTSGNAWTTKVPTYNASYLHYFYCMQYIAADGTVTWSDVVYDQATTEAQSVARTTSTNLSTLQSDYATFKQTTQNFESTIGTTYATKTELQTTDNKIENLEIGGRNLVTKAARGLATDAEKIYTRGGRICSTNVIFENRSLISERSGNISVPYTEENTNGAEVTLSFECKLADGGVSRALQVYGYQSTGLSIANGLPTVTPTNEWQKYVGIGTVHRWTTGNGSTVHGSYYSPEKEGGSQQRTNGEIYIYDNAGTNYFIVRNVKIEKGNKATDWTPAPEDVDAAIDKVDSKTSVRLHLRRDNWTDANWGAYASVGHADNFQNVHVASGGTSSATGFDGTTLNVGDLIVIEGISTGTSIPYSATAKVTAVPTSATGTIPATVISANNAKAIESRVSTAETSITQANNQIALKANASDVYTKTQTDGLISTEVSNRNSAIEQSANAINLSVSQTYTTKTEFNALEVGGRNLLANSGTLLANKANGWAIESGVTVTDGVAAITTSDMRIYQMPANNSGNWDQGYWEYTSGDTYTVSADVRADAQTVFEILAAGANNANKQFTVGTSWTRCSFTFSCTTVGTGSLSFYRRGSVETTLYIRKPKLEKGNKATDWTPAPEDMVSQTEFESAKSEIKATTDGITSTVSKISSAKYLETSYQYTLSGIRTYAAENYSGTWTVADTKDAKVGDTVYLKVKDTTRNCYVYIKATVTAVSGKNVTSTSHGYEDVLPVDTIKSTINQSADSVKIEARHVNIEGAAIFSSGRLSETSLNNTYDTKGAASDVQANLDNLEIGGRNLLLWSGDANHSPVTRWGNQNSVTSKNYDATYDAFKYVTPADSGNQNNGMGISTETGGWMNAYGRSQIANGNTYTFSIDVMATLSSGNPMSIKAFYSSSAGDWNAAGTLDVTDKVKSDAFVRVSTTFTLPSTRTEGTRLVLSIGAKGSTFYVKNPKLETGNRATDWSPAPEDVDTSINANSTGLGIKWNYSNFSDGNNGEAYLCAREVSTGTFTDAAGWVWFNGAKRTVPKGMVNPNGIALNKTIYVVCRLSSASATTGTNYIVWYNSGWKYLTTGIDQAASGASTGTWTWAVTTDMVLASFVMLDADSSAIVDCQQFTPPLTSQQVTSGDTSYAKAAAAQATADNAAPKSNAVKRTQRIYYRKSSVGAPSTPGVTSSNWVTQTGDVFGQWTAKVPRLTANADGTGTKYLYLYTCEQREMGDGTLSYTTVLLDDSNTIIDGGTIITGSIAANRLDVYDATIGKISTSAINLTGYAQTNDIPTKVSDLTNDTGFVTNDDIQIGGRNLFKLSDTLPTSVWVFVSGSATNGVASLTRPSSGDTRFYQMPANGYWAWEPNTPYVASVEARITTAGGKLNINPIGAGNTYKGIDITTEWKRYEYAFVSTANVTTGSMSFYNIGSAGSVIELRYPKLEKGNKATDWSPAPEDVAADISSKADPSDIPTKVSDLTNDSGFQNSSQVETAITSKGYQTSSQVETAITSKNYATQTSLNTEINQRKAQYGTCSTGSATDQAKAVTCSNFELVAGNELTVKFSIANTYASGAVQLNVNSKGAKNVWVSNAVTSSSNQLLWGANAYITFRYDGTQFIVIGEPRTWYGASTTAEGTAAKTDTTAVTGCVICKGAKVELAMTNANTATAPTLNIQSTGAKNVYFGNGTARPTKADGTSWLATNTCTFTFDGQYWRTAGKTYIDANSIVTGYLGADRIEAGSLSAGVISATSGTFNTANIPNLDATKITSGTIDAARINASALTVNSQTLGVSIGRLNSIVTAGDDEDDVVFTEDALSAMGRNLHVSAGNVDISTDESTGNITSLTDTLGTLATTDQVDELDNSVTNLADNMANVQDYVNPLTSWVNITEVPTSGGGTEPALQMGTTEGNAPVMQLTNSMLQFRMLGDANPLLRMGVVDGESLLEIMKAVVLKELRFNNFAFIARPNGNVCLKYIGKD